MQAYWIGVLGWQKHILTCLATALRSRLRPPLLTPSGKTFGPLLAGIPAVIIPQQVLAACQLQWSDHTKNDCLAHV